MPKRIVIIGSAVFDSMEYHLNDAFCHLGYDSRIIDYKEVVPVSGKWDYWLKRVSDGYDRYVNERLLRRIVQIQPDLVVGVYRNIHPVLIKNIKRLLPGAVCIHINQDQLTTLQNQQVLASDYDYWFSKDPFIVDFMKNKANLNAHYLPEAFNPRVHVRPEISKAEAEEKVDIDVLVWGAIYPYRARMIEYLVDRGIHVTIFGHKGPYFPEKLAPYFGDRYLIGEDKNQTLYGARIVLNNFHYAEVESVNLKYFETNGIGAFQLCDYKKILKELSPVNSEQYAFRSIGEAAEKIEYYLERSVERYQLANEHYEYFRLHHTYACRVQEVMNIVAL